MRTTLIVLIVTGILLLLFLWICLKNPTRSRGIKRLRKIIIIGLLVVIAYCAVREFAPRGLGSIFHKAGVGEDVGSDDRQTYADSNSGQGAEELVIIISDNQVNINGRIYETGDMESLKTYLSKNIHSGEGVKLVDDYAISSVYHEVLELLYGLGANVTEESQ